LAEKFETGDIVALKSGGPAMAVAKGINDNGDVKCVWFSSDGYRQEGFFLAALLVRAQPPT
jgi:uncharacterized protein YodC (DUF2158 family)